MKTTRKKSKWVIYTIRDPEAYQFLKNDSKRFHVPMAVLARVILGMHLLKAGVLKDSTQLSAEIARLPEEAKKLYVK